MKSKLQERAEAAFARFNGARKPIVIEFAGVPKAGKTSTLGQIQKFLKRCGFRVEVVVERASICPIRDKKHANFNVWTAATTLAQILEKTQTPSGLEDPHVLILDRGLFDAMIWLTVMERLARIRKADRAVIEQFLLLEDWRRRITGVIVMTVSPRESMEREKGSLPVEGEGGSIMNEAVLQQMLQTTRDTAARLSHSFRIFEIDTSGNAHGGPQQTAESVARIVLDLIEEQLQEEILFLPSKLVATAFGDTNTIEAKRADGLLQLFSTSGRFKDRKAVEADKTSVQALPVVVVRNRSGHVLRLRRKERRSDNPLHEKLVIWAGGHVRREDGVNGRSILRCAVRELQEELRLDVEPQDLRLLGSVRIVSGDRTRLHVAIVYEWRAQSNDVAIALSNAEFFERRGTSLSGRFLSIEDLARDVDSGKLSEPWSVEILRHLLPEANDKFARPKLI